MKSQWLKRDLILGPHLCLCLSEAEYRHALKHCRIPDDDVGPWIKSDSADATVHILNTERGELCGVVCLRERDGIDGVQIAAMLVHEAVHVWQYFRDRIGERTPSAEFEAYSIQAIAQRLMYAYAERRK